MTSVQKIISKWEVLIGFWKCWSLLKKLKKTSDKKLVLVLERFELRTLHSKVKRLTIGPHAWLIINTPSFNFIWKQVWKMVWKRVWKLEKKWNLKNQKVLGWFEPWTLGMASDLRARWLPLRWLFHPFIKTQAYVYIL